MKMKLLGICGALLATAACAPAYDARDNDMDYKSGKMEEMFNRMDTNHNGYITSGESTIFARKMFVEADLNNDNLVSYEEFADHAMRAHGTIKGKRYTTNGYQGDGIYNNDGELVHGQNEPYNARNNSMKGDVNQYKGPYGSDYYYNDQYDRWERR